MYEHLTVFEHEKVRLGQHPVFTDKHLHKLQVYHGDAGVPYFSLMKDGVKFKNWVGVLMVGNLMIEVLPKADKPNAATGNASSGRMSEQLHWRTLLIGMLRAVESFDVHAPSSANLQVQAHTILDLYIDRFLHATETLIHQGLSRQYRTAAGNRKALKGRLDLTQQLRHNFVHREHFYVHHTIYDYDHVLNSLLFQTLELLGRLRVQPVFDNRIQALKLAFPDTQHIRITESMFSRLRYTRKTRRYKPAIDIARLLLLNYHPDLSHGYLHVLALMFNMENLWERFLYASLKQYGPKYGFSSVHYQTSCEYGQMYKGGSRRYLRPDLLVKDPEGRPKWVLDAKWKRLDINTTPASADMYQMYIYMQYYRVRQAALLYPQIAGSDSINHCLEYRDEMDRKYASDCPRCHVIGLPLPEMPKPGGRFRIRDWQIALSAHLGQQLLLNV